MFNRIVRKFVSGRAAFVEDALSNEAFVILCYREFLGREPDPAGKQHFLSQLDRGLPRLALIKSLVSSPEYLYRLIGDYFPKASLPNLYQQNPSRYIFANAFNGPEPCLTFRAETPADYDWIESMIIDHGYYDTPGIWALVVDNDKHIIAEIISRFTPSCCLEIGCSTGSVPKLLDEMGIYAEGIEISHLALALAYKTIRQRIHFGDILTLPLESKYDMVIGLDVFEHLNPNKLPAIIQRCFDVLRDGGFVLANIPAYGLDPIFGDVYPVYLEPWRAQLDRGEPFSLLHVDDKGWPLLGHLIWAPSSWWQVQFEQVGFRREPTVETALHAVYNDYFKLNSPGRQSLYVFSKNVTDRSAIAQIIARIELHQSQYTH